MIDAVRDQIRQFTLDNGLRLVVSEDHTSPIVAVNLWYGVGSRDEEPGRTGFAHLFEHLMFAGSANVPAGGHFDEIQKAGGTLNATTWLDRTNYFQTVPTSHLELVLWLEADRLGTLREGLTIDRVDNQRDVVKNEKRQSFDNRPYGHTGERLQAAIFPKGHPYHHHVIGSMEDLDAASLQDAHDFHARWYAPNNAVLSIVGDVDPERVHKLVVHHFGHLPANPAVPGRRDGTLPDTIGGEHRHDYVEDVPSPAVAVGYRIPPLGTQPHDHVRVAAAAIGQGRGSRLHRRLVLEEKLAQPAGGFLSADGFVGDVSQATGMIRARDGVATERILNAFDEVVHEAAVSLDEDELERVRALAERGWHERFSKVASRADLLSQYGMLFGDPLLAFDNLDRIRAVTPEQARQAVGTWFVADNRAVLTYQPIGAEA